MNPDTRAPRIATGLLVVLSLLATGLLSRSPWLVAIAAPFLVVLYALGKWQAWRLLWQLRGAAGVAQSALVALPIQFVLAGILYLVGLVVLEATRKATILLDYRAGGEPIVTRAVDPSERALDDARSYGAFEALSGGLRRFKPRQ